jgi:peptidyl-prolyl cis-trans isomerase SurA
MRNFLLSTVLLFIFNLTFAQSGKDVLLTVAGTPVTTSEFKRVYNKNLNLVKDESQKSVDGYLDLFIDYKLKVAEAYDQKMHEDPTYIKEFNKYRDQLSRNYIYETKVTNELTREAYERSLEEINASHILVRADYEDTPQDTLKAYNKIKMVYDKAKAGEDFEVLAKTYSEEPNIEKSEGNLGFFTVFGMLYPFETMAYNTEEGEVSEIVRTQFGYHIIKVNERRKRVGQISVAHIMISDNGSDRTFDPKERIDELRALIMQGESFESLAKQYSDDKNSGLKGGKLQNFRRGDLRAPEFENAAYALEKPGDISQPVKTKFGWHIIKLLEKLPLTTFEEEKAGIEEKVKTGDRSKKVVSALNDKIKEKFNYKKVNDYMPFFDTYVTDDIVKHKWVYDTIPEAQDKVIFTIGNRKVTYNDFAIFLNNRQRGSSIYKIKKNVLGQYYDEFETEQLKNYFKDNLELENDEYAATIDEYRSGLLIFDVMNKNIWQRAKTDSIGLQKFYETVKDNYQWKERVDAVIVSTSNKEIAEKAQNLLKEGKTQEELKEILNVNDKVNIIVSEGLFEIGQRELPKDFEIKEGVSKIYTKDDGYCVIKTTTLLPGRVRSLDEVKGKVMSDYQNYLEKKWMEELRRKYTVEINKKALKKVKKELNS